MPINCTAATCRKAVRSKALIFFLLQRRRLMQLQVTQVMTTAPLSVDSIRPVAYARCMPVHRGPADAWGCRMRVGDDMADACTRAISRFLVPCRPASCNTKLFSAVGKSHHAGNAATSRLKWHACRWYKRMRIKHRSNDGVPRVWSKCCQISPQFCCIV